MNVEDDISISCKTEWGGSEGIYIDVYLDYPVRRKRSSLPAKPLEKRKPITIA